MKISTEHQRIVDEIVKQQAEAKSETAKPEVLHKPQELPGEYQTKTNGRNQTIVSKKETLWSYCGIDIV
jgi:hypothetical protein